jgi:hypothetical protein
VVAAAVLLLLSVLVALVLVATCSFPLARLLLLVAVLALLVVVASPVAMSRSLRALVLPPLVGRSALAAAVRRRRAPVVL